MTLEVIASFDEIKSTCTTEKMFKFYIKPSTLSSMTGEMVLIIGSGQASEWAVSRVHQAGRW